MGLITVNQIIFLYQKLEQNDGGIRHLPGTTLKNQQTGDIIYTPPQDYENIVMLMSNLEQFNNDNSMLEVDPLIKIAIIRYQFENTQPFYDGNERAGRIINILYLVTQ
jgi:Fic family protein